MRFCVKCGEPIEKGNKVCNNCRTIVRVRTATAKSSPEEERIELERIVSKYGKSKKIKACFSLALAVICMLSFGVVFIRGAISYCQDENKLRTVLLMYIDPTWIAVVLSCVLGLIIGKSANAKINKMTVLNGKFLKFARAGEIISEICFALFFIWFMVVGLILFFVICGIIVSGFWSPRDSVESEMRVLENVFQNLHIFNIANIL